MKMRIIQLVAVIAVLLMTACGSSKSEETPSVLKNMVGEWHLVSWNGSTPSTFDTYLSFAENRTFEIYQRLETSFYQKYSGAFSIKGDQISGTYTDETPWGSSYQITLSEDKNTLTLLSTSTVVETSIYARGAIPTSVKSGAKEMLTSRAARLPL